MVAAAVPSWQSYESLPFCLFVVSLLRADTRVWLIGLMAFAAFLVSDLMKVGDILRGPALASGLALVIAGLLLSLVGRHDCADTELVACG